MKDPLEIAAPSSFLAVSITPPDEPSISLVHIPPSGPWPLAGGDGAFTFLIADLSV